MKHLLVLVVVGGSLLAYSQTTKSSTGEMRGTVVDQNGSPISFATVYAVPQDLGFDDITPPSVKTNSSGQFNFHGDVCRLEPTSFMREKMRIPIRIRLTASTQIPKLKCPRWTISTRAILPPRLP